MLYGIDKLACAGLLLMVASCSGNDAAKVEAESLYESALTAQRAGRPAEAIAFLDSLDANYKSQTEIIRKSIDLRPSLIIDYGTQQLDSLDTTIKLMKADADSIGAKLTFVSLPSVDGYYVETSRHNPKFTNTTGISPRVSSGGEFYLVSSVNPSGSLHHSSISLTIDGQTAVSGNVPYDGAVNYRYGNSELITFSSEKSAEIGRLAFEHRNSPAELKFIGDGGRTKTLRLSASEVSSMATLYEYSVLVANSRTAALEQERIQKKIELARSKVGPVAN